MKFTHEEQAIINSAVSILESKIISSEWTMTSPQNVKSFLKLKLASHDHELFAVIFLTNQHQVISFETMFRGTINAASVYPREVVKRALEVNSSAVIFAHNHPSDSLQPSDADKVLTKRLKDGLDLVDIRVLDHLIVTKTGIFSFAEEGLL